MRKIAAAMCCVTFALAGCGGNGGGTAWLPLDEGLAPGLHHLSTTEQPPLDALPGPLYAHRKVDDQRYFLYDELGEWDEGRSGAFFTADGVTLLLRQGDSVAQHAEALTCRCPLAVDGDRAKKAANAQGFDALGLLFIVGVSGCQGMAMGRQLWGIWRTWYLLERLTIGRVFYDFEQACYVDSEGRPVRIGGDLAQTGLK